MSASVADVADQLYPQYRAPKQSDEALVVSNELPELSGNPLWTPSPIDSDDSAKISFCGASLEAARRDARREVVELAINATGRYRSVDFAESLFAEGDLESTPIWMAGHQPELFHSGVWFKNFLLHEKAQQVGGIAINFQVDNDICRQSSINVPTSQNGQVATAKIAFDQSAAAIPWELRKLKSESCWNDFPERVTTACLPITGESLLKEFWSDASQFLGECDNVFGQAFSIARHRLEGEIGLRTLEISLSQLAQTRSFARFSIQLLSQLPRFQAVYNSQLTAYREQHQIRSQAHPVPALASDQDWFEAPWWVYSRETPERKQLWAKVTKDELQLTDREGWEASITGRLSCDNAATQWLDFASQGVLLRPRALLTTMYHRMLVADQFVHGIGGGKYDQLTDQIIRNFFGLNPPPMTVATATMRLPFIPNQHTTSTSQSIALELNLAKQRVWDLQHNADHAVSDLGQEATALKERKAELLSDIPERGDKWEWHREISSINKRLKALAEPLIAESKQQISQLSDQFKQQQLIESREFSFCLFPRDQLSSTLSSLAKSHT